MIGDFAAAFLGSAAGSLSVIWFSRDRVRKAEVTERPFGALEVHNSEKGLECSACHSIVHRYEIWDNASVVCMNCVQEKINDRAGNAPIARK